MTSAAAVVAAKKKTSPKAPAGKAGRRTLYTPENVAKIVQALKLGATYELAAAYAGITYKTFNAWTHAHSEFSDAIKTAEGAAAVGWLAKIERAAAEGNWQAAAWKLERRYPQLYGRTVQQQVQSGEVTHKIVIEYSNNWREAPTTQEIESLSSSTHGSN